MPPAQLASRNKTALPALCGLRATPFTGQPSDMVSADKAKQADELRAKLRTLSQVRMHASWTRRAR